MSAYLSDDPHTGDERIVIAMDIGTTHSENTDMPLVDVHTILTKAFRRRVIFADVRSRVCMVSHWL
jgi:hypothetical protein